MREGENYMLLGHVQSTSTLYSLKCLVRRENKDGTLSFELSVKLEMFDVIDF